MRRRHDAATLPPSSNSQENDMQPHTKIAFTVMWRARDGEARAAADIIRRFAPLARQEPGLEVLTVNQNASDPSQFLFYELFTNAEAFAAHQETPHFKEMILGEALPKLASRERVEYRPL
jgi:quinol monooxygenase YgiN